MLVEMLVEESQNSLVLVPCSYYVDVDIVIGCSMWVKIGKST